MRPLWHSVDLRVAECWLEQNSCMILWCDNSTRVWAIFVVAGVWDEFVGRRTYIPDRGVSCTAVNLAAAGGEFGFCRVIFVRCYLTC